MDAEYDDHGPVRADYWLQHRPVLEADPYRHLPPLQGTGPCPEHGHPCLWGRALQEDSLIRRACRLLSERRRQKG